MTFRSQITGFGALAVLAAVPAFAQTPSPSPSVESTPSAKPAPNLSDKLKTSNGVIQPKDVDPTIEKPAPKTGDANVVPPSSGSPQPK